MKTAKPWSKTTEPSSYDQIYRYFEQVLEECLEFINEFENDYYQGITSSLTSPPKIQSSKQSVSVNALIAWSRPLNELRNARSLHDIRNGKTIRDLLSEARAGTLAESVSEDSCHLMQRILDTTNEHLYSKIPILTNKIADCMNLMQQYFLSFYDIENIQDIIQKKKKEKLPDQYVETAYTYEKSRWLHIFHVNKSLKILREMQQRVEDSKGIVLSSLSRECQELAVRCDCTSLSYVFALPESYIEARRAVVALRTWLLDDTKYTSFIQTSLKVLDEKYAEAKKMFEIGKAHLSQAEHRANSFRIQLSKVEQENETNEKKVDELGVRLENKERDYLSKRLTYEVYEDQLKKMLKEADNRDDTLNNHLSIERFQQEIRQFSKELPKLKAQMEALQGRLEFFKQRKQELLALRAECRKMDHELQLAFEDKILKENELNRVINCRQTIRNIYKCRATNDLPQKIFYSLPVKSKLPGESTNDDLSKAIRIVAKYIGRDWSRLYWNLPFYPMRGKEEVSKDINSIDDKYHRGDVFRDQAIDSLGKWRRFHTRAKLDDLMQGLRSINRLDILQIIDRRIIKPKHSMNDDQEEIDPRKREIEDLNRKLNRLFEKIHTGAITTHETYVYSKIGLDPLQPVRKHRPLVMH
ncbi:unnamed protein product [Rotaria magnacalcarata]|uniref:Death domain-containing protein n=2 Tax=Rotaria magnacalcarata TaxID=392030 RepID=A0A816MSB6_9BILA|nr:unnamed protein product [Rotaria magnacalcarata]CAF2056306.1 unnamed protein product [Rotaria magnacalcarata]CAF3956394.1 unnamed protein product [Rotaria magnacalcarata]CAF4027881.1 unnamed protein product [Rotaria magnacalcarata]